MTLMETNSEELLYQGVETAFLTWQEFFPAIRLGNCGD